MPMKNASSVATKWANNLANSTQSIREGVESVSESPMAKAANRTDAYLAGIQAAVANGKYQDGLRRVTLEEWKRSLLEKGIPRIATGARASEGKFADFMQDFLPHVEAGQRALESMPRGDLSQNIQRAVAMMQHNARFRRRR